METSKAIDILTRAGYKVVFTQGAYQVSFYGLSYRMMRLEIVNLAKDIQFVS